MKRNVYSYANARKKIAAAKSIKKKRFKKHMQRKEIKKVVRSISEKKYITFQATGSIDNATGVQLSLLDIPQGDTDSTRDGDQLYLRSIYFKAELAVGDNTNFVRCTVFQWFPTLTGIPALTDIYLAGHSLVLSPINHDKRFNFRVLYDKVWNMRNVFNPTEYVEIYLNKRFRRYIQYVGGATAIADNRIFMIWSSDSGAAPHPTVNYDMKVNFSDL